MSQTAAWSTLGPGASRVPDHPVSRLLVVINSVLYFPSQVRFGVRTMAERVVAADYSRFLL